MVDPVSERATGIEPASSPWQGGALPLSYVRRPRWCYVLRVFRVLDPAMIPREVPEEVYDAVAFAWAFDRNAAARYGWGDLPLHVLRFQRKWMHGGGTVDAILVPDTGVEYSADILRRLIAREGGFGELAGTHHGVAVVTAGVILREDVDQLPDLPDDELRQWTRHAEAAGVIIQYRATVGVFDGWRFQVEEVHGQPDVKIVGYEPGEPWQERHNFIDEVVKLDGHLRDTAT